MMISLLVILATCIDKVDMKTAYGKIVSDFEKLGSIPFRHLAYVKES